LASNCKERHFFAVGARPSANTKQVAGTSPAFFQLCPSSELSYTSDYTTEAPPREIFCRRVFTSSEPSFRKIAGLPGSRYAYPSKTCRLSFSVFGSFCAGSHRHSHQRGQHNGEISAGRFHVHKKLRSQGFSNHLIIDRNRPPILGERLERSETAEVTLSAKNQIVIPREAREALGVKARRQAIYRRAWRKGYRT
jgi:hypothetical protein